MVHAAAGSVDIDLCDRRSEKKGDMPWRANRRLVVVVVTHGRGDVVLV